MRAQTEVSIHLDFPHDDPCHRERMMKLSAGERVLYAWRLFDLVREVILASFPPDLTPHERRSRLYERIYGEPLPADFPHGYET